MNKEYWKDDGKNYWDEKLKIQKDGVVAETVGVSGLQEFMVQTFTWMSLGLAVTGFLALLVSRSVAMTSFLFANPFVFILLLVAEIGMVIAFGVSLRKKVAFSKLFTMFLTYAILNGLTLSVIFLVYTSTSIAQTFFVTAGTFGGMSLYGYVTKRDLTGLGNFAIMGLWGIILALIVNFFVGSSAINYAISLIGVGVFVVLTAYDTQKLKMYYAMQAHDEEGLKRTALGGALTLYLDFINLFLFLLRFLGNRR